MSLSINVVNSEDEQSLEDIKEQLKDVNEKIVQAEKKIVSANRNLTYLYTSDKNLETLLVCLDDEERELCERQLNNYGDMMDTLETARGSHEHHISILKQQINHFTEKHENQRNNLKSSLLALKLALSIGKLKLSPAKYKKIVVEIEQELEQILNKQAKVEREVIRLRTKKLQAAPDKVVDVGSGVRIIELRERQARTEHQLDEMRNLLTRKGAEKQQLSHVEAQAAVKNIVLNSELVSLQSDLEMANFEYADVYREYRDVQREHRLLRARVDDAITSSLVSGLMRRHKEVIWNVITLDASTKREKQRCRSLKETLYAVQEH